MYENLSLIRVARPHASHACESMPCDKTERNINARALANYFGLKQIKTFVSGGLRKEKTYFFAVSVCSRFEWPVEVAEMKTTHSLWVVLAQKKVTRFGRNIVNAF